jgi:beta-glucanase (GH16 family)
MSSIGPRGFLFGALVVACTSLQAETACSTPMWQDEFNGDVVDDAKWQLVEGDGCDQDLCGWGNDEKQWYLARNARIESGALHIIGQRERSNSRWYTSAKLTTQGRFAAQYGRFEARMKIPEGNGFWPAFWMMPKSTLRWPLAGEIDILESSGHTPEKILGAIHFGSVWPDNVHFSESILAPVSWTDDFHVYAVEWRPQEIRWFVDDKEYGRATPEDIAPYPWVFDDRPFYLILNLALGGTLGGKIKKSDLPGELVVDYVRAYPLGCD